jgi:hypothetical protein
MSIFSVVLGIIICLIPVGLYTYCMYLYEKHIEKGGK